MNKKQTYVSPITKDVGYRSELPVMGTMTLYVGSPYVHMTTVSFGQGGYTSSDGSW